jgi:hypothetical protein
MITSPERRIAATNLNSPGREHPEPRSPSESTLAKGTPGWNGRCSGSNGPGLEYAHNALFGEPGRNVIDFALSESQFRHLLPGFRSASGCLVVSSHGMAVRRPGAPPAPAAPPAVAHVLRCRRKRWPESLRHRRRHGGQGGEWEFNSNAKGEKWIGLDGRPGLSGHNGAAGAKGGDLAPEPATAGPGTATELTANCGRRAHPRQDIPA